MITSNRLIQLGQLRDGTIILRCGTYAKTYSIALSSDEAQHLSNRLQAYAKGQQVITETVVKD